MDGINRHVLAISQALNVLPDVEVGVVTLHPWGDVNDALKDAGVKCWSLGCVNGHQLKVITRFCRVMREFRPEVVHDHVTALFENVVLKWLYPKVRRVSTIHFISDPVTTLPVKQRVFNFLRIDRLCGFVATSLPDACIYISQGVRDAVGDSGVQTFVVYNPMSFTDVPRPIKKSKVRVIGTACRVESVKNPLAFTRVIGEVTKRLGNVEGWIIGEGSVLSDCKRLAAERGYDKILFMGRRNDAKQLIAQMDCFVMTSKREGLPTALLEAMSLKTPIAFMDGEGGLHDLVKMDDDYGPFAIVCKAGDEASMIDGISSLLGDPKMSEEYAERAFEVGRKYFDLSSIAQQIRDVYEFSRGCT